MRPLRTPPPHRRPMPAGFRYDESLRGRMSSPLIIKRASASRTSGEWNDDDYDVLVDGVVVGRIVKAQRRPWASPGCGQCSSAPRGPHTDIRL
jgi:hypothetical protein